MATVDYKKELTDLVDIVVSESGSDIHLSVGVHPMVRVSGSLIPLVKKPILTPDDLFLSFERGSRRYHDVLF